VPGSQPETACDTSIVSDIRQIVCVLDCLDADRLADFWAALLGYDRGPFQPPYVTLTDPRKGSVELLLQQVPEAKSGKNRMHLDLRVADMEAALSRARALGATVLAGPTADDGWITTLLADPDGNEFDLLVPPAGHPSLA